MIFVTNWIERYIYAVGQRLPRGQREDIKKELHSLILDAVDEKVAINRQEYGQMYNTTEDDVIEVLENFGNPEEVASNYLPQTKYLIGPGLYHIYMMVLKIVLAAVGIGLTVATLVSVSFGQGPVVETLLKLPLQFIGGAISATGSITIVFALIQYFTANDAVSTDIQLNEGWRVKDLPPVPLPSNQLKRSSIIAEICFISLAIVLVNLFLDRVAVFYVEQGATTFIPLFNMGIIRGYIPYINLLLLLSIALAVYKLKQAQWTITTRLGSIVLSLGWLTIIVKMALNEAIFNPALGEQLLSLTSIGIRFIIVIVIVATAYEIIVHIVNMFNVRTAPAKGA